MARSIRFGNAIVCEHVAQGSSNKHILINTFSGDIIVRDIPAQLTLGLYIEVLNPKDLDGAKVRIEMSPGEPLDLPVELPSDSASEYALFIVPVMVFKIAEAAELKVSFTADGIRRSYAIRKRIFQGEIPS